MKSNQQEQEVPVQAPIIKRDEIRPTGTGSTSLSSNNKRDEVRPTGRGNTSSSSSSKRDAVRPIQTGRTSVNSTNRRNEVSPIGTGSTSVHSTDRRNDVRSIGTERTRSSFTDKRGEMIIRTGSTSSKTNKARLTGTGSSILCGKSNGTGDSSYFAKDNELISKGTASSGLGFGGTHQSYAFGFQGLGLRVSNDDDT